MPCQTLFSISATAVTAATASGTVSGFGTLCGSFGARKTAKAGLAANPRRSRKRRKLRTTDRPRAIELRSMPSDARRASQARKSAADIWEKLVSAGGSPRCSVRKSRKKARSRP